MTTSISIIKNSRWTLFFMEMRYLYLEMMLGRTIRQLILGQQVNPLLDVVILGSHTGA